MELFLKLLHIASVSLWLGGALYIPQLFRLHCRATDGEIRERLLALSCRLYIGLMTPSAVIAIILGSGLVFFGVEGGWLPVKLSLVMLLVFFHLYCGRLLLRARKRQSVPGPMLHGSLTLIPLLLLTSIVALAVAKPF